ncbi:hypothetical protein P8C59_001519 [Phyllachora maydis]|uniref:Trichothecene 3-O-acetyltransferase-like N-terminal domain-containing protein n=1 Tax=Phyllachora maydis TaxID=1825666 RepID=A0AAD9HYM3_9PEZI|nr:hypothetical protein P8C59_001519 [Phyllachora maydis]
MGSQDAERHGRQAYAEADIMGQFSVLNSFSVLAYGFELPSHADRDAVAVAVQTSLAKLVEKIPFLGYQVATDGSGTRTAEPWPQDVAREGVRIRICDDLIPSMAELLADKAPVSKLDGKVLCPWPALPLPHGIQGPVPIVHLQVNFIRGGVILNLSAHHTMMDGTADFQFLKLLATVLNGRELDAADVEQANRRRDGVVPLLAEGEPAEDCSYLVPPPGWKMTMPTSWPKWAYFMMPEAALARLADTVRAADDKQDGLSKDGLSKDGLSKDGLSKDGLSKDDILSAFYWQRLCAIRIAQGAPPSTSSKLTRAINARAGLGIPAGYLGAHVSVALVRLPMGRVTGLTVAQLARALRQELRRAAAPRTLRSVVTAIARTPPAARGALLYTGTHDVHADVGCTNVSRAAVPKGAWGPLGPCRWYRRPDAAPIPGSFRLQEAEGGVHPIAVCLFEGELKALEQDEAWGKYATCIVSLVDGAVSCSQTRR